MHKRFDGKSQRIPEPAHNSAEFIRDTVKKEIENAVKKIDYIPINVLPSTTTNSHRIAVGDSSKLIVAFAPY